MVTSILVVCTGNICRSPVAQWQLMHLFPHMDINSAGLEAFPGLPADMFMVKIAKKNGIKNTSHSSQKFSLELGLAHDLILTMESYHLSVINYQYPQLSGKSRLITYLNGRQDICDPYQKSDEIYRAVYQRISEATNTWMKAL